MSNFSNLDLLNLSIGFSSVILSILSIIQILAGARVDRRTRDYFIAFYIRLILFAGANVAGQLLRGVPGQDARIALTVSNFLEFLLAGILACVAGRYILSMVDPERREKAPRILLVLLMALHFVLLVVSQFTDLIYFFDSRNVYHRAELYPLSILAPMGMFLISVWALIHHRKQLNGKERLAFASFVSIPIAAMVIQAFVYGLNIVVLSTVVTLFCMFLFIVSGQTERYYRQSEENTRLKVNLMLSQIQPHFLYNSLAVIQEISRTDPKTTEQAIGQFATFLRHNMRSINSDKPIPFTQELEHVKSYLALQTLRFGDDVRVVYDLECTDFSLPTLTLQPLVENAVSHGIRATETGIGQVTIRTRAAEDHYELSVIDDGVGFDPEQSEGRDHDAACLALRNIRDRLARVSGAELRIRSSPGQGTDATILLPKEAPVW